MSSLQGETGLAAMRRTASLAAAADRQNQPLLLVRVCAVAVLLAFLFLLWSCNGVRSTVRERNAAAAARNSVRAAGQRAEQLRSSEGLSAMRAQYPPERNLLSKLNNSLTTAGLEGAGAENTYALGRERNSERPFGADSPFVRTSVEITFRNVRRVETLLAWIELASKEVPGLYVMRFNVSPQSVRGWDAVVQVGRWEMVPQ